MPQAPLPTAFMHPLGQARVPILSISFCEAASMWQVCRHAWMCWMIQTVCTYVCRCQQQCMSRLHSPHIRAAACLGRCDSRHLFVRCAYIAEMSVGDTHGQPLCPHLRANTAGLHTGLLPLCSLGVCPRDLCAQPLASSGARTYCLQSGLHTSF